MQTTFYPRLAPRLASAPPPPTTRVRVLREPTRHPGDWRYQGLPRSRRVACLLAALLSAGLHVGLIWGPGRHKAKAPVLVREEEAIVQLVMPPLPDEEEEKPVELDQDLEQAPAVDVPRLTDIPSVDVSSTFVQPLQMNVPLQTDFRNAGLTSIPVHVSSGSRPSGLRDIFDLKQLDRIPEVITQPAPVYPYELKKEIDHGRVVVEFVVDSSGTVREPRVISSTHTGFERASTDAVAKWRFRPGVKGGKKVSTRMSVPILFSVEDGN